MNPRAQDPGPGQFIDVNETKIYLEDRGSGTPLVLIHGGLSSSADWAHLAPEVTGHLRLITPDSRAHGRSTNPSQHLSYARIADDMAALIAALGLAQPFVGGWSDGGQAALEFGVRHPGVAAGLIVGGAYPEFVASGLRETHRELLAADEANVPDLERLEAELGSDADGIKAMHLGGPAQWRALVEQSASMWLEYEGLAPEELRSIQAPVLVLAGDRDEVIPLDLAVSLYRDLPNAELAVCSCAGHEGPATPQRAAVFGQAIRDFVDRTATAD